MDFKDVFYDQFKGVKPVDALKEAIAVNEDRIMDLNRQQLDRGLDSEGRSLGKYANFKYKNRFQPVDLLNKGPFRAKFSLQISDKETEIFSQDEKEEKLKKRYGKNIFGIPDEFIPNMQDIIEEDFIREYQERIES